MLLTTANDGCCAFITNYKLNPPKDPLENLRTDTKTGRMILGIWCLCYHAYLAILCSDKLNGNKKEAKLIQGNYARSQSKSMENRRDWIKFDSSSPWKFTDFDLPDKIMKHLITVKPQSSFSVQTFEKPLSITK